MFIALPRKMWVFCFSIVYFWAINLLEWSWIEINQIDISKELFIWFGLWNIFKINLFDAEKFWKIEEEHLELIFSAVLGNKWKVYLSLFVHLQVKLKKNPFLSLRYNHSFSIGHDELRYKLQEGVLSYDFARGINVPNIFAGWRDDVFVIFYKDDERWVEGDL